MIGQRIDSYSPRWLLITDCHTLFSELDMFEFIGGALFIDCECGLFKDGDCGGGGGGGGGAAPL